MISKPYSQIYNLIDGSRDDDKRMRRRVGIVTAEAIGSRDINFGIFLERQLGIAVLEWNQYELSSYFNFEKFYEQCDLSDLFDTIFYSKKFMISEDHWQRYLHQLQEIFASRQLAFRIDQNGTVHPHIDAAFGEQASSLIALLHEAQFSAARKHIESAWFGLRKDRPDYIASIRSTFLTCENLFKVLFPKAPQLSSKTVGSELKPFLDSKLPEGSAELRATHKLTASFIDWIDGAHFYRHEDGKQEPNPPSEQFTVLFLSQGIGYARWLAGLIERQT